MIYAIRKYQVNDLFNFYAKHRSMQQGKQIIQQRSKKDLTTNYVKFMQQTTNISVSRWQ